LPSTEDAAAPTQSLFSDPPVSAVTAPAQVATFTPVQAKIIAALDGDSANVDDICDRSTLPASVVMAELTLLQIRGAVQRLPGNRFAKKESR
jgi:predicted Rossmann fold nucleotide-binding protein DprA/Smf involved in DNA uptake